MAVAVLGPLEVTVDGRGTVVPRGTATRLLHLLAANAGRVVPDRFILDSLWDDQATLSVGAMRNTVMRLRDGLGPAGSTVERVGDGYRLSRTVELDIHRLDAVITTATVERDRHPALARALLDEGLSLVRGEPWADVASEPWARPASTTWSERIAAAEDLLIDIVVDAQDVDGVSTVSELTNARPDRERRWVRLVQLLDAAGRRAEAMRTCRRARVALAEFGLSPGIDLLRAETSVLMDRVDPTLRHVVIDLAGVIDERGAESAVRRAIGASAADTLAAGGLVGAFATWLSGSPATIIVANAASLPHVPWGLLATIVQACPGVSLLVPGAVHDAAEESS